MYKELHIALALEAFRGKQSTEFLDMWDIASRTAEYNVDVCIAVHKQYHKQLMQAVHEVMPDFMKEKCLL